MSTYSQTRLVGNTANDAEFRAIGKFISDSLTAAGWAKTADTGQVDWTTVTRVAINTAAGYEIRTSPAKAGYEQVYVKIEYGQGSNVAYTSLWITLGYASDGAGTLTGTTSGRQVIAGVTTTPSAVTDRVSAGEDWFAIALNIAAGGSNTGATHLSLERLMDADGNPQTAGWNILGARYQLSLSLAYDSSGPATAQTTYPIGYFPPNYAGTAGNVFVGVLMPQNGSACYPMRAGCVIADTLTGTGAITFALYPGKSQTWITSGVIIDATRSSLRGIPTSFVAHMRWD